MIEKPYCAICHRLLHQGDCAVKSYKLEYGYTKIMGEVHEVEKIKSPAVIFCIPCLGKPRGKIRMGELINS